MDFVALVQPIVDVEHVIWESPAASAIRRIIRAKGIAPGNSRPHAHLSSPLHAPVPNAKHRLIVAGEFDTVTPPDRLAQMAKNWPGTDFIRVRQGHFGYRALAAAKEWITTKLE
jgi:pimeloyl-ACP methyl ester carboxylesterase